MKRTFWPYADDEKLLTEIRHIITNGQTVTEGVNIHSNVIDPFQAIFNMTILGSHYDDWLKMEQLRQSQKSIQNTIGYFHQHILGMVDGWYDPGLNGIVDSRNDDLKVVAEIKNKWNTMNANATNETYDKLADFLDDNPGYTGYLVKIIPQRRNRYQKNFHPSNRTERHDLKEVDGATYYELVTGDKNALRKLFECLPAAIETVLDDTKIMDTEDEIKLKELFELAF